MSRIGKSLKSRILSVSVVLLLLITVYQFSSVVLPRLKSYTEPYYTESVYKGLEHVYNHSQYRVKKSPGIIPDETVFSYAAGAYLRGVDPIFINSEITPLGKYFISLSIFFLKNDKFIIIPFAIFTLITVWLLARLVLASNILALVPVVLLVSEKLFLGQLIIVPLLDIIQLPFILLTLYFFIREENRQGYWITALLLGIVAATKSVITAALLCGTFFIYFILRRQVRSLFRFVLFLPLSAFVLLVSYTRTFMDGYSLIQFVGFQKWIILYQRSKLLFPFSVWRLIFLNQWQAWWGDMRILKAEDWQITWPIFTSLSFVFIFLALTKRAKLSSASLVLCLWFLVYGAFLSLGVVSSRFLLPFLPVAFIIGTYLLYLVYQRQSLKL